MKKESKKIYTYIKEMFERNRFIEEHATYSGLQNKLILQTIIAVAFFILSIANIFVKSYIMLIFTLAGGVANSISAVIAKKINNANLCTLTSITSCSLLFAFFVIYGGNDGFACLWVVLLPFLSMVVMNFVFGLCASVFFQIFLIIVFWTPVNGMLFYQYNEQFCLRFPLFFFVTFMLGLSLTISMQKSRYNECIHLMKLEEMTAEAYKLARIDTLTELANRRCAYEEFKERFISEECLHCIIMGDIDSFKIINDTHGHEFGDEVLTVIAKYIKKLLPQDYLKARWGGEEFLIAANEPINNVYARIEKLREAIAKHKFVYNGTTINATVTFGISEYKRESELYEAINIADARLYKGKKESKNCTVIAD